MVDILFKYFHDVPSEVETLKFIMIYTETVSLWRNNNRCVH